MPKNGEPRDLGRLNGVTSANSSLHTKVDKLIKNAAASQRWMAQYETHRIA